MSAVGASAAGASAAGASEVLRCAYGAPAVRLPCAYSVVAAYSATARGASIVY